MELNQSADRIGLIVVCVRKFEARSLVWGNKGAPRLQVMGSTEGARSGLEFHAAAPVRNGGERSWSWAAVSLSMTTMGPPHWGQSQSGLGSLAGEASGSDLRWLVLRRVVESKAAGEWRGGGWQGSQSGGCGRSLWAAGATGSGAGTHRAIGSSTCVHCCERNRASER